jgi:hypothetical protein
MAVTVGDPLPNRRNRITTTTPRPKPIRPFAKVRFENRFEYKTDRALNDAVLNNRIPSARKWPRPFGMNTRRTACGRYCLANSCACISFVNATSPCALMASIVRPSTPGAPRLRRTRYQASHSTSHRQTLSYKTPNVRRGFSLAARYKVSWSTRTFLMCVEATNSCPWQSPVPPHVKASRLSRAPSPRRGYAVLRHHQ